MQNLIKTIECQFLSCYPVNNIDWQDIIASDLSWNDQKHILDRTYYHRLNREYPINEKYQLNFFKKLIYYLEQSSDEVHDEIYEVYCKLQIGGNENDKFSYKHYSLPKYETTITLRESKSFVADGTTGLCSWPASLALSDWLLHNVDVVQGRSVIELGAGTGLCGFIVSKCCNAEKVILSDGSHAVIDALYANRQLNFACENISNDQLSILYLPWNECELVGTQEFDVILAADVVYDSMEFDDLVNAIDFLFISRKEQVQLVLAATVRNEVTLNKFLSLLGTKKFMVHAQEVVSLEKSHLFWDRSTPVKIMTITRNKPLG